MKFQQAIIGIMTTSLIFGCSKKNSVDCDSCGTNVPTRGLECSSINSVDVGEVVLGEKQTMEVSMDFRSKPSSIKVSCNCLVAKYDQEMNRLKISYSPQGGTGQDQQRVYVFGGATCSKEVRIRSEKVLPVTITRTNGSWEIKVASKRTVKDLAIEGESSGSVRLIRVKEKQWRATHPHLDDKDCITFFQGERLVLRLFDRDRKLSTSSEPHKHL